MPLNQSTYLILDTAYVDISNIHSKQAILLHSSATGTQAPLMALHDVITCMAAARAQLQVTTKLTTATRTIYGQAQRLKAALTTEVMGFTMVICIMIPISAAQVCTLSVFLVMLSLCAVSWV